MMRIDAGNTELRQEYRVRFFNLVLVFLIALIALIALITLALCTALTMISLRSDIYKEHVKNDTHSCAYE